MGCLPFRPSPSGCCNGFCYRGCGLPKQQANTEREEVTFFGGEWKQSTAPAVPPPTTSTLTSSRGGRWQPRALPSPAWELGDPCVWCVWGGGYRHMLGSANLQDPNKPASFSPHLWKKPVIPSHLPSAKKKNFFLKSQETLALWYPLPPQGPPIGSGCLSESTWPAFPINGK